MTTAVPVPLGARSYDILIGDGLLDEAGSRIAPLLSRRFVVVIADATVIGAHGARLTRALDHAGIASSIIEIPPGEPSKSFASLERLCEALLDAGVERSDLVIAFGGGVIGDLTGFAASIIKRGCRFAQIPTTLLAQVDSSVGGKTAINARAGKNLVGAFHQPSLVLADVATLATLPARELRSGYAEIVKYAALGDAPFFDWLDANGGALLGGDRSAQVHAVAHSCAMKGRIVAADERETGERALLNLGHTFGHALEAAFGFSDRLTHGEAVAAGMGLAFDYSAARGYCQEGEAARLKSHLRSKGLPAGIRDIKGASEFSARALRDLMMRDKKNEGGRLTLILARKIGEAFVEKGADADAVEQFLRQQGAA
jgi:3-dehydroquinate synthase